MNPFIVLLQAASERDVASACRDEPWNCQRFASEPETLVLLVVAGIVMAIVRRRR